MVYSLKNVELQSELKVVLLKIENYFLSNFLTVPSSFIFLSKINEELTTRKEKRKSVNTSTK